ncbi:MAG: transcriptional regulator [Firmicutes bacterium HGW-Firmicutes-7]|nr:MAG: transcriptional regulator [Firmicutes bacterium HGW-Firmicutes-7]
MKETNRIEFKRELNDKLEKEVIGFLNNNEGGHIYIGIDDDGYLHPIDNIDALQLKIKDRIKHNIYPSTMGLFDVSLESLEDEAYIKVTVASGSEKPYYIKSFGMSPKGCFLRIGSATEPMTNNMIEDLFARRTRNSIGKIKSPKKRLTFNQLKIYYQEQGYELNERFIESLELMIDEDYNYAAYLLSDDNGVSIKVGKYDGIDRCELVENNEYGYCSLIKATNRVLDKLKIENTTLTKITGDAQRIEKKLVDEVALREAVINAIIHNDYSNEIPPKFELFSDRIEITSSGGLIQGMEESEFFSGISVPRNKELMRVFKDLELVEHLGSGIARILRKYDKSIYQISNNYIRVVFPIIHKDDLLQDNVGNYVGINVGNYVGINSTEKKVLELLSSNPTTSIKNIAQEMELSSRHVERIFKNLKEIGIVERVGSNRNGKWKVNI